MYSQTAHLGKCLSAALGVRIHRAFTVMSFGKTMGELSAGAELHDNVHVLVVLQCLNEVDDISRSPAGGTGQTLRVSHLPGAPPGVGWADSALAAAS